MKFLTLTASIIVLIIGAFVVMSYLLMVLWNWIMTYVFNLPRISFWMSMGILILVSVLTNNVRFSPSKSD
jgi:predicted neutral ceramidase superfamily lipid hydrolase